MIKLMLNTGKRQVIRGEHIFWNKNTQPGSEGMELAVNGAEKACER
jgi:hypothetical protein